MGRTVCHGVGDGDYGNNDIFEDGINDNNDKDDNNDKLLFGDVQAPGRRGVQWVGRLMRTPTPLQVS